MWRFQFFLRSALLAMLMAAAVMAGEAAALAQPPALDRRFRPLDSMVLDAAHRQILEAEQPSIKFPERKAAVARLQQYYTARASQHGEVSMQAFGLLVDLARIGIAASEKPVVAAAMERAERVYQALMQTAGLDDRARRQIADRRAELLYYKAEDLSYSVPRASRLRVKIFQTAIAEHQRVFGDAPRQWALYAAAARYAGFSNADQKIDVAYAEPVQRAYMTFADRIKDRDQQILSRSLFLNSLVTVPARRSEALALARQLSPLLPKPDVNDKNRLARFGERYSGNVTRADEDTGKLLFDAGESNYDPRQAAFDKELREEGMFERDFASDAWLFMQALKIRQRDEAAFMEAMKRMGSIGIKVNARSCRKDMASELCALRIGDALAEVGQAPLAWEYARIAKAYVDKMPFIPANDRAEAYSRLAAYERKAGFGGKAVELERLAKEAVTKPAASSTASATVAPAQKVVPTPKASESGDDLKEINSAFGIIAALKEAAPRIAAWDVRRVGGEDQDVAVAAMEFMVAHVRDLYAAPLPAEQKAFETKVADGAASFSHGTVQRLLIQDIRGVPTTVVKTVADGVRRRAAVDKELGSDRGRSLDLVFPTRSEFFREKAYVFSRAFTTEPDHAAVSRVLWAADPAARTKAFNDLVKVKYREEWGITTHGDTESFLRGMAFGFEFARRNGDIWLARTFAAEYFKWLRELSTDKVGATLSEAKQLRIDTVLALHNFLAGDAIERNQRSVALEHIGEAERLVAARLSREWRSGGASAADTLRALRPLLRELADRRASLVATAAPQDFARAIELAAQTMQYPQIADVALEIIEKSRQRRASSPQLNKLLSERVELAAELTRIDSLSKSNVAYRTPSEQAGAKAKVNDRIRALDGEIGRALPDGEQGNTLTPLTVPAIRAMVSPGEQVLTSIVTEQRTSFALVTATESMVWQVPLGRSAIENQIAAIRRGIEPNAKGDTEPFPFAISHGLFNALLGPVRDKLLSAKHVLFAPDGPLLGLPPHLLLTKPPEIVPTQPEHYRQAKLQWLVYGPAFSIVPGLRVIEALRKAPPSKATVAFAGIGDPVLPGDKRAGRGATVTVTDLVSRRGAVDLASFKRLGPLPETADELKRVSTSLGGSSGDLFLAQRASKPALQKVDWSRYRIISFATHGLMSGEISGVVEPALVLTPPREVSSADNGLLSASEIMKMKLDSELVVLSACNTAAADGRPQAESLSGLAKAFFTAGTRNLVVSHWSVPSASTTELMVRMAAVRQSGRDFNWAQSLRAAMIDLIEKQGPDTFAHPLFWAPFVVVGADRKLQ
jgi:CHAT domain-containing protein